MTVTLTPRERLMRAIHRQEPDVAPCAFMSFAAMRGRAQDPYQAALRELEMGLDSILFIPSAWRGERPHHPDLRGLPVRIPPEVTIDLWIDHPADQKFPVLHKVYHTPAGDLSTAVLKTPDWTHGNTIPYFDDYQIPRALKRLITGPEDLDVFRPLLLPPNDEDVAAFRREVERARAFRDAQQVLLAGGWGVGADMAAWLCGLENLILFAIDHPEFVDDLLGAIAAWNEQRMRVVLEAGVDLYIRRAWYEGADFWSPALYRRFLLPIVRRDAALAHEYGAQFGYIMTTGALPMMKNILDAGVDVLIGVDPLQAGQEPLRAMRDTLGDRVCLWGGVNGAITVEEGTEDDVRAAVAYALATMRGVNGFILSPVDNITDISLKTWRNVDVFIETWRTLRGRRGA